MDQISHAVASSPPTCTTSMKSRRCLARCGAPLWEEREGKAFPFLSDTAGPVQVPALHWVCPDCLT